MELDVGKRLKRIFLLTDGQVANTQAIINFAALNNEKARIHTFGIGSGCDKNLIKGVAKAGRGSHSLVSDTSSDLNGLVIRALRRAIEPSLKNCKLGWFGEYIDCGEVFRNQLCTFFKIIPKENFESLKVDFSCEEDPITKGKINLQFTSANFEVC